jgi:hypothetical protein
MPQNMLLGPVEYQTQETTWGVWRRFLYPNGHLFVEFVSHRRLFGLPWLHYTRGISPETGSRLWAKGIVAIGRKAYGVLAIGQLALGLVAIGQLAIGLGFGLGQATTGVVSVGQVALGISVGIGQLATARVAMGQISYGHYVLAQIGWGQHVWDMRGADPAAVAFFKAFLP